jgi:hypothetical protein
MKRFMNKKVVTIGLAAGLALGAAGIATAYWTSSGSGTGTANTSATADSSLSYTDNVGSLNAFAPSVAPQAFKATVTDTSATQEEYVASVSAYLTVTESALGQAYTTSTGYTCSSADYLLDNVAGTTSSSEVPLAWTAVNLTHGGGNASTAGTDTIGFNDLAGVNQDACQGAQVTVNYTSN